VPGPLLEATAITKSFAGIRALQGVSFELRPGEVHALVGENGAGKSTFIKIVTGAQQADGGNLRIAGQTVDHIDPASSRRRGIAAIYQQPALFPHLSVAENIALAAGDRGVHRIDWRGRSRRAAGLLARVGAAIDPERLVETLTMPEQQLVEIAKALGTDARVLIMDEPTASLTDREVEHLLGVVAALRDSGHGVIYISHRLEEIFAVANRITVLRDGSSVATLDTADVSRAQLITLMVGRELASVYPKRPVVPGEAALELRAIGNSGSGIHDVSLIVRRGEIVGLAGLVGSGRTEVAETVFGLTPADAGHIVVNGKAVPVHSPAAAIEAGIADVPEDRRQHGVVVEMSVASNTTLANLDDVARNGLIDRDRERKQAQRYVERFRIKTPSVEAPVGTLSGGNQQKVALARWLSTNPTILLLDEPTQGVDVGAKAEIHALIQELVEQGLAILMISSELPEILGMSDRIAVMREGTIRGVIERADATQARILALALGDASSADSTERRC
jgi:rhamnose transport system ATP-binding protein